MIHVKIITGFLGAGKTTFINQMMQANPDIKYGIIENEFGKENIDSKLLLRSQAPMVEMTNGCICCSINEELYEALNLFYEKRTEFDVLIIEATGIADPSSVAEPFLINENVKKAFVLDQVICLVDSEQIEDRIEDTKEAVQQISFSNVILLNKIDLVSQAYLNDLTTKMASLNPLAKIIPFDRNVAFEMPSTNFATDFTPQKLAKTENQHGNFKSITIAIDKPFKINELHFRMIQFMLFQSKDVYRMKAIVYDADYNAYILQSVGSRVSIDQIEVPPLSTFVSKFVFIGKDIIREGFEKMLMKYAIDKITH